MTEHNPYSWPLVIVIASVILSQINGDTPIEANANKVGLWDQASEPETVDELPDREEVIDDLSEDDAVVNDLDEAEDSLPLDPVIPPVSLTDTFATPSDFFRGGDPTRLVVLTASWCGYCPQHITNANGLQMSESFDAEVQLIDVVKYPAVGRLLNPSGVLPATLAMSGEIVTVTHGVQSRAWFYEQLSKELPATQAASSPVQQRNTYSTQQYYYRLTPKQKRLNRRYGRWR